MKKSVALIIVLSLIVSLFVFTGCNESVEVPQESEEESGEQPEESSGETLKKIEHVGNVPDEFGAVIEKNLFKDVTAYGDRLLKSEKAEFLSETEPDEVTVTHRVFMMDLYGNVTAEYSVSTDKSYYAQSLLATDDGGFLFVLGFSDYAIDQEKWASDGGFASRVIKCDKNGKPQFDTALENIEGHALRFAFQKNGKYYFFGTHEVPETKTRGVYSYTDVYAAVLDENGAPVNSTTVAGSDFDELIFAEKCEGGFLLSISSQSSNGDFKGSGSKGYDVSWKFTLDDDLRTVEKKKKAGRDYFDALIGFRSGEPVYRNDFAGFDAGYPTACVDYGDFYLIVSEHSTGEYENTPPYISSIWYYTETVYSAYDRNGDLIFRTAVDSTPDYDSLVESLSYPDQSIEQSE